MQKGIDKKSTLMISKDNCDHLISLIVKQVEKDFASNGYSIHFSGKPEEAYESLFRQISGVVEDMFNKSYSKLLELLYKIDVNENIVKLSLSKHPEDYAPKIISKLILEREFKKVLTKENIKLQ